MTRTQDGNTDHDGGGLQDDRLVVLVDALVDDPLDQARDGQVQEDQGGQQDQRQRGTFPIWFDKGENFLDRV